MRPALISLSLVAAVAALGCGSKAAPAPESSLSGSLTASTFRSTPSSVVATDPKGVERVAPVSADGSFKMTLPKGQRYALSVDVSGGRVPIVMPRRSGHFDRTFRVSSNGVAIALGSVQFLASGPKPSLHITAKAGGKCDGTGSFECVDDNEQSVCEDGHQGQDDGADGECVNGVDVKTHAACSDPPGDDAEQADANAEMAVPERSAPSDASGCDDNSDGETNDD